MTQSYKIRLLLLAIMIIGGSVLLLSRLWFLQIEHQKDYMAKLPKTRPVLHRLPGPRGRILDRNGQEMARNKTTLQIGLSLEEVVQHYKDTHKGNVPKYRWKEDREEEADIVMMVDEVVFKPLERLGMEVKCDLDDLRVHYRTNRGEIPYVYAKDVDWRTFSEFAEHNHELPGVTISQRPIREYPFGALAGHLMGYVKLFDKDIPPEDKAKKFKFYEGDDRGVAALERSLDKFLRGKPGFRTLLINEHGRLDHELTEEYKPPKPGDDVYLTIDVRIQYIAEMALREALCKGSSSNFKGVGRGAVVVMKPDTGEVLAMAAVPSYDPNQFIPSVPKAAWDALNNDPLVPLLNRAIQTFAPGSTFKIPVAMSGFLAKGKMNSYYHCGNYVTYGGRPFPCWTVQKSMGGHGSLELTGGIKNSCNCFFYQYGNDAGIENIGKMCKMLGMGVPSGIGLDGEAASLIPGPQYYQEMGKGRWGGAQTANVSIGQGEVLASPLQMCSVVATVANGSKSYFPTLVHHRVDRASGTATPFLPRVRTDLLAEGIKPQQIEMVRKGMWKVVNEQGGTGKGFRSELPEIKDHGGGAGKTGTAQAKRKGLKDNHTWFICFAPYDAPKIAVCVLVQGGNSGGGTASPVAKRVVEQTLAMESGAYQVDPKTIGRLPEAKGHFNFIETISYPGENVPADAGDDVDSDESNAQDSDEVVRKVRAVPAGESAPLIKESGTGVMTRKSSGEKPKYKSNSP